MDPADSTRAVAADRPATTAASIALSHRQILTVFSGVMAGMFVAAIDQTIVSTAAKAIGEDFDSLTKLAWMFTSYSLASTAVMPLAGKLSDLFGRKTLFQWSIVVFTAGSLLCGVAPNFAAFIAFRAIQGVGGGALIVLAFAIVGDIVSPAERGRYQGLVGSVFAVASVIGPLIGGVIVSHASWRWIFLVNLPVGIAALGITNRALALPFARQDHTIDWLGAALVIVSASAFVVGAALIGERHHWSSPGVIACGVVAIVSTGLFVRQERRAAEPVLPPRLFRSTTMRTTSLVALFLGTGMFGAIVYLPQYLQIVKELVATNAGLRMIPVMGGILVASTTSGRLIARWGRYRLFPILGLAIQAVAYICFAAMDRTTPLGFVFVFMAMAGFGIGMVSPVLVLAVQNDVAPADLGAATSATTFIRQMGATLATAIFGAIIAARVPVATEQLLNSPEHLARLPRADQLAAIEVFMDALHIVFWCTVPVAVIGCLLALRIPENPLRSTANVNATGADTSSPR
jgi:EmrB/QacA subfamily drug resistance transporter